MVNPKSLVRFQKEPKSQVALIVGVGLKDEWRGKKPMPPGSISKKGEVELSCSMVETEQTILKETRVLHLNIEKDFKVQDTYSLISIGS